MARSDDQFSREDIEVFQFQRLGRTSRMLYTTVNFAVIPSHSYLYSMSIRCLGVGVLGFCEAYKDIRVQRDATTLRNLEFFVVTVKQTVIAVHKPLGCRHSLQLP